MSAPLRPLALVTGGARRVGRAICLALARAGCDVRFTYNTSTREADAMVDDLCAFGVESSADQLDLDDLASVERYARSITELDILVHNASSYERTPIDTVAPEDALRAIRINALAPLMLSRHLKPALTRSVMPGGGAIVAMCDIHALGQPRAGYSAYSMSKSALAEMVRSLAIELAPRVRVNGVAPGVVAWPESGDDADEAMQRKYLSRVPLARAGTPEDAAEAVRWLALDALYTTGQIIRVDGGRSLR